MTSALWITLIGMGMVFVSILLLWGLMALLVKLTSEKESSLAAASPETTDLPDLQDVPDQTSAQRTRRAAAASVAVAVALGKGKEQVPETNLAQPGQAVSPWLVVHRAAGLSQTGEMQRKKTKR